MSDPIVTIAPNFEEWDFRDSETPSPCPGKMMTISRSGSDMRATQKAHDLIRYGKRAAAGLGLRAAHTVVARPGAPKNKCSHADKTAR